MEERLYDGPAQIVVGQAGARAIQPQRPLEKLDIAADRIGKAASLVEEFHARFFGPTPANTLGGEQCDRVPGHQASLSRLFEAIERLEQSVVSLSDIG